MGCYYLNIYLIITNIYQLIIMFNLTFAEVYGVDKYGHTLITFTFVDIKTDDLAADFDE